MADARTVPVLMHHHVSPSPGMITVSPENFESQIAWLAGNGWTSLTLDQYAGFLAGKPVPRKSIVITFDDGYLDNWVYAHPILQKYGMHAVVFVVTGWMGEGPQRPHAGCCRRNAACHAGPPRLRSGDLRAEPQRRRDDALERSARGHRRRHLRSALPHPYPHPLAAPRRPGPRTAPCRPEPDLAVSRDVLQDKLGEVSDTLCWPYGDFDQDTSRWHASRASATCTPPTRSAATWWAATRTHLPLRDPQPPGQLAAQAHRAELQPLIAPLFNGFKARQKKMVPGP
jgi:peptidoglycan/xylan/chitin deacetylase (PgdA/CDA1 family)